MATITIKNLTAKEAFQLLENVQRNHAPSYAIQGKKSCRFINTDTVNATVKPEDNPDWKDNLDMNNCTFKIYSSYWTESTLREFMQ